VAPDSDRRSRFEAIAAEVFEPLQRFLRRRADPNDADDALNETLLTLWRRLDDIPDDAVLPWSYGVARRIVANQRRSAQRRLSLAERMEATATPAPTVDPAAVDEFPEVAEAMAELEEPDREVLTLWAWEQLEPKEIAVVLDVSGNAANLRLSRARKRLEERLSRHDPPDAGHKPGEDTEDAR
jgi:RNA polymerase sigma-70 factor (ECF subfamily)